MSESTTGYADGNEVATPDGDALIDVVDEDVNGLDGFPEG